MKLFLIISQILSVFTYIFAGAPLTPEIMMGFFYPSSASLNFDDSKIIYAVELPSFEKSEWYTQLWILDTNSRESRPITFTKYNDTTPKWSPDGMKVAFISDRAFMTNSGEKSTDIDQLWLLDMSGGDPHPITNFSENIDEFVWSHDGTFLIVLIDTEKSAAEKENLQNRMMLKLDETVKDSVKVNKSLFRLDIANGNKTKVADLDFGVEKFTLSEDNRWIVYQTNYTGDYNDEQKYDLWLLDLNNGDKKIITNFPGPETNPKFSPDGKWITYLKQTTPDVEFAQTDLMKIGFLTESDTINLTKNFDLSVLDYDWYFQENKIILQVAEGTETTVYSLDTRNSENQPQKISLNNGNILDILDITKSGKIFCLWENSTHLPEIIKIEHESNTILTNFSEQLKQFDLGKQSIFRWNSYDGTEVEGLLFLPADFDKSKKYPLILTLHGGPYGRFRQAVRQSNYSQLFASDGYVVFSPNPRGSSGYSDEFGKALWYKKNGYMGGVDYQDIMIGLDSLIAAGFVDEERMGVTGGSYGGYLTNWIISQTDRFSAAVSKFGIFSLFTDWSNSWQPAWEKMFFGVYYWEQPISLNHPYIKHSPAFYVDNIHTPVLILHGEEDRYTNLANSQEMYQALKTLNREVKLVIYPRENHGISNEPNHKLDAIRRTKKWFDTFLKK